MEYTEWKASNKHTKKRFFPAPQASLQLRLHPWVEETALLPSYHLPPSQEKRYTHCCAHTCAASPRTDRENKARRDTRPPLPAERLQHRGRRTAPRAPGQEVGPLRLQCTGTPRATRHPPGHSSSDTSNETANWNLVGLETGCFAPGGKKINARTPHKQ